MTTNPVRGTRRLVPILVISFGLIGCAGEAPAEEEGRVGEPPPPAAAADSGAPAPAATSIEGASVSGEIPGLSVQVVSTYAYRDWMPRMGGPKGEDGGSPLHVMIGLLLENEGTRTVELTRSGRLGPTGTPLSPVALDDMAAATVWPLELAPGSQRRLQIGTRDGPYFPVGEALDIEIDLADASGSSVRISVKDLPVGRTD